MDVKAKLKRLEDIIAGDIICEWSKSYEDLLKRYWNRQVRTIQPLAFIIPANANDIVVALKFCINSKFPVTVRSGGHECSLDCYVARSVVFDLSNFKEIKVDHTAKVVEAQAGALVGEINRCTLPHNMAAAMGSFPYIGIGGQALHVGFGSLSRMHGLVMDNILEYSLVDSRGYQLIANEQTNQELFWGMKMFGANFGILKGVKMKLHNIPKTVFGGRIYVRWASAVDVIKYFRNLDRQGSLPRELSMVIYLQIVPAGFCVLIRLQYNGPVAEGKRWFEDIKTKADIKLDLNDLKERPFLELQEDLKSEFPNDSLVKNGVNHFLKDLSDEYINIAIKYFLKFSPDKHAFTIFQLVFLGGAIKDIPVESSPFPYREARFFANFTGFAQSPEAMKSMEKASHILTEQLEEYEMAPDYNVFSLVLKRLVALKLKHDPANVFRYNWFNIDPAKLVA